jgi:hypothetical protein
MSYGMFMHDNDEEEFNEYYPEDDNYRTIKNKKRFTVDNIEEIYYCEDKNE